MSESPKSNPVARLLGSDLVLGALVAILSVMTAWSAYQGTTAGSRQADANVQGQKMLSLSNTEFLRANQSIVQDYTMYDGYYVHQDSNQKLTDYYKENFSDELKASMERKGGPFDDAYYKAIYKDADESYDEAIAKFEEARVAGDKADRYQAVVLIFAVGLALAAWASIAQGANRLRPFFALISLMVLIFGVFNFLMVFFS